MQEFFDHHLKGAPAPEWLDEGGPYLEIEEHLKERAKGDEARKKITTEGGR